MIYHDYQVSAAPPWLVGPNAVAWWQAHGLLKDVFVDAARIATKASWPLATPADGLPFIGSERSLPRVPSDTDDSFRATLHQAYDLWDYGSTEQGILAAIERRFPGSSPSILTYWDNPSFFGIDDTRWARWALFMTLDDWGAAATWGSGVIWGDPALTWGITAPVGEVAWLRDIIRLWNEGSAICTVAKITTPDGDIEIHP